MKLTPFYYRSWGGKGEEPRHILVWGRLSDAKHIQTSMREYTSDIQGPPPIKVPVVNSGRVGYVSPNRLTLLEVGEGCQPPQGWLDEYKRVVGAGVSDAACG